MNIITSAHLVAGDEVLPLALALVGGAVEARAKEHGGDLVPEEAVALGLHEGGVELGSGGDQFLSLGMGPLRCGGGGDGGGGRRPLGVAHVEM